MGEEVELLDLDKKTNIFEKIMKRFKKGVA
jgi:hypothetical protein